MIHIKGRDIPVGQAYKEDFKNSFLK